MLYERNAHRATSEIKGTSRILRIFERIGGVELIARSNPLVDLPVVGGKCRECTVICPTMHVTLLGDNPLLQKLRF